MSKIAPPNDDAPISGQKFFLINMASPSSDRQKAPTNIFKVKYVCETLEEAKQMAQTFRDNDSDFDTYVGPVGKWIPFLDNPLLLENNEYQHNGLTELISDHRKIQKDNTDNFMQRVDRETQYIIDHSKRNSKSEEEQIDEDQMLRKAVTTRYNIYQLQQKIDSLLVQRTDLDNVYLTIDLNIREQAEKVDLPKIDEVGPQRFNDMPEGNEVGLEENLSQLIL